MTRNIPDENKANHIKYINRKFKNQMLIYNLDNQFAHEEFNHYYIAGTSSFIVKFTTQPMEILKIRFQLQHEPIAKEEARSKYRSVPQAIRLIYKEEGLSAFWKGIWICQVITIIFNIAQFYTFDAATSFFRKKNILTNSPFLQNFVSGGCAGFTATTFVAPLDVIKTRIIAQDLHSGYQSFFEAVHKIFQKDGLKGLYRGVTSSYLQTVPLVGLTFTFYCFFGDIASKFLGLNKTERLPSWTSLIVGALSGSCAKTFVYPLDLVEKRLQIQGFSENRKTYGKFIQCRSISECLLSTLKTEGFKGIYKGLTPATIKCAWTTAFTFYFYNLIIRLTSKNPNQTTVDTPVKK